VSTVLLVLLAPLGSVVPVEATEAWLCRVTLLSTVEASVTRTVKS